MAYIYDDPEREDDPHALPNIEVFRGADYGLGPGWFWWSCLPGCLPEGDASGPFDSEALALADAREGVAE